MRIVNEDDLTSQKEKYNLYHQFITKYEDIQK